MLTLPLALRKGNGASAKSQRLKKEKGSEEKTEKIREIPKSSDFGILWEIGSWFQQSTSSWHLTEPAGPSFHFLRAYSAQSADCRK